MARSARPVSDPEWTTIATRAAKSQKLERAPSLLVSARVPVPLVWGLLRPVVVLPEDAAVWPPERLEVVLHHELAHVKRWDHLTVLLEHLMSTLHWINPLVWIAVAKLEREREHACDDAVLRAGVRASEYARQLLAIANPYGRQARMLGDLAMARTSVIEERLRAILDPERNRGTTTFLSRVATGAVLLCMTLPIASVWIWASSPPTELSAAVFQTAAALQGKSSLILEGAVQDAEGNPVEGAVVVVTPNEGSFGDGPVTVRTDRNGRFSMSLIHSATYTVRVVAEGYVPWVEKRAGPGKALEVTLYRGFTLQGIVMDGHNRNSLAGARVEAKPDDLTILPSMPRLGIVETETDGEGRFQLSGLGEGFYTVSARAKGYGRTEQTVVRPGESLELFLFPGSLLIGTVRDEEDRPIEGAFIQLFSDKPLSSGYLIVSERSDPNGKFEILGTPPGTYQMAVRHRQRAPVVVPDIEVGRDEEVELDIRLIRGANVVGRLVDFDGVPISGVAAVEILDGHSVPPLLSDLRCRSGENGYFELPLLPPGAHVIRIDARGYVPRQLDVDIGDRQEPIDLGDIDLDSGLSIGGRVTDEDGRPIVGARVLASGSGRRGHAPTFEALSGEDGDFLLGGLSEGSYWVSAVREGYAGKKAAPVRAGTENLNLVLEPGGSISGVVVDDQDNPMRAFRVSVGAVGRGARPYESVAHLQGRFTVKDLSPDTYVLEVVVPDHVPATVSDIEVEAGAETNVGDVRVSRGCRIQGYVVNTTGTALPGAVVRVSMPWTMLRKSGRYQTVTNREGFFSLTGVPEITDGLVARHPDYAEGRVGMLRVGTSKEPVEVRIVLSRGGSVEGWVRGRHGLGIEGRVVLAYSRRMGAQPSFDRDMTTTDSNGYFFLENLSAGPTRVQVYRRSGV